MRDAGFVRRRHHQQKLLAAVAYQQVARLHDGGQPGGKQAQHGVTHRVTVAVVYLLEMVKIQQQHAQAALLLLRRLVALGVLGIAHEFLQPGEALLPYAIAGIVFLLPLSWAPRWVNLAVGLTITVVPVALTRLAIHKARNRPSRSGEKIAPLRGTSWFSVAATAPDLRFHVRLAARNLARSSLALAM